MKEKRIWKLFALFVAAVMLFAPEYAAPNNTLEGTVVAQRVYPSVLELATESGVHYGILLDENTRMDDSYYMQKMTIKVTLGERVESALEEYDACVEGWFRARKITIVDENREPSYSGVMAAKPVIYLYPEEVTDVTVRLD